MTPIGEKNMKYTVGCIGSAHMKREKRKGNNKGVKRD